MKSFIKDYDIKVSADKVWDALTKPELIEKWSETKAVMDDKEGTEFKLWGGDIFGKNIEVKKDQLLKQEWYGDKWDAPSIVTMELTQKDGVTHVKLTHENIPDESDDDFSGGWDDYYFGPLKDLVEGK